VSWCGEVEIDARGVLAGPGDPEEQERCTEAREFLRNVLADGPRWSKEVKGTAAAAGIKERTLHRARRDENVADVPNESQRGRPTVWHLPDYVPPPGGIPWHEKGGTKSETATTIAGQRLPGVDEPEGAITCHTQNGGTKPLAGPQRDQILDREWERLRIAELDPDAGDYGQCVADIRAMVAHARKDLWCHPKVP
jgi:hypothetical protein